MNNMPWFRVYSDLLDDIKIKRICKLTGHPKALLIGIWVTMLAIANRSDERGSLLISDGLPYTIEDLSMDTGLSETILEVVLANFRDMEMLNGSEYMVIKNWNRRQFKSDNSTARVKKYRGQVEPEPEPIPEPKPKKKKAEKPQDDEPTPSDGLPRWIPGQLRPICKAFSETANVPVPDKVSEDWLKSLWEMQKLGADVDMIISATERLKKNKMVVVRPGALIRTVQSQVSNRKTVIRIDADGNEISEVI